MTLPTRFIRGICSVGTSERSGVVCDNRLPRVLFFNFNGSGMGHMNRCLLYARRLRGRAEPVFFSLASVCCGQPNIEEISMLWS